MINVDMLLPLVQEIQTQLREMKTTADIDRRNTRSLYDIDRRNTRSLYDNLAAEMSQKLAAIDNKLEIAAKRFEERMDRLEQLLRGG